MISFEICLKLDNETFLHVECHMLQANHRCIWVSHTHSICNKNFNNYQLNYMHAEKDSPFLEYMYRQLALKLTVPTPSLGLALFRSGLTAGVCTTPVTISSKTTACNINENHHFISCNVWPSRWLTFVICIIKNICFQRCMWGGGTSGRALHL